MARTEGQWKKGISLITPSEDVPILLRNSYLNFGGTTIGESGYGFRDNAGTMQFKNSGGAWTAFGGGSGGISDGDKGDITVSDSGATWTIDENAVTFAKMQDITTGHFIGRHTAGSGDPQQVSAAQARSILGLGAVATSNDYNDLDNKPDLSIYDNFEQFADLASFPVTGSAEVVYVAQDTGYLYRWTGSTYAQMSAELALGETATTAYRGDRGATAFAHTSLTNNPHNVTKAQVGLGSVDNTSDADKPVSTATQTALDGKATAAQGALADTAVQPESLATVATSNDYTDLDNTPAITTPDDNIFVLAMGQSNMARSGVDNLTNVPLVDLYKYEPFHSSVTVTDNGDGTYDLDFNGATNSNVYLWNASTNVFETATNLNNIGLGFALRLQEETNKDVYVLNISEGSNPIESWLLSDTRTSPDIGAPHLRWDDLVAEITPALAAASKTKVDVCVWHQGEANSNNATQNAINSYAGYQEKQDELLYQLRQQTWFDDDTPFIAGELNYNRTNGILEFGRNDAICDWPQRDPFVSVATSYNLSASDGSHFEDEFGFGYFRYWNAFNKTRRFITKQSNGGKEGTIWGLEQLRRANGTFGTKFDGDRLDNETVTLDKQDLLGNFYRSINSTINLPTMSTDGQERGFNFTVYVFSLTGGDTIVNAGGSNTIVDPWSNQISVSSITIDSRDVLSFIYDGVGRWVVNRAGNTTSFYKTGGTDVSLADGGTGSSLSDPGGDRIMFWDDSAGTVTWLNPSTGLTLSGTTLTVRSASETVTGISERATNAETVTGTDTSRHITPANLTARLAAPGNIGTTTPVPRLDYTRAIPTTVAGGNLGTTETFDWSAGTRFSGTADQTTLTISFSNAVAGQAIDITITGSASIATITWPTMTWLDNVDGTTAPTVPGSGEILKVNIEYDGTTYWASPVGNYPVY